MKKLMALLIVMLTSILLSGCLYPAEERAENQAPDQEQLAMVQKAVDQFREETGGLLPIKNREVDVDQFIKYPIDFEKIVPKYMNKLPANSFEKGGLFQYVIWDAENNPQVKLVDLRGAEKIRELNIKKGVNGYAPIAEIIQENLFQLNYKTMGYKDIQTVPSPYSATSLPLVITGDGTIYIDYSIELNRVLQNDHPNVKPGEDIRHILIDKYPVLPAYSLPYTVNEKNEPIFMTPIKNKGK